MKNNGNKLIILLERNKLIKGIWDPYYYRDSDSNELLSDYVNIKDFSFQKGKVFNFKAIEYKNIPQGNSLVFHIEKCKTCSPIKTQSVGEQALLMGTMRAYLGNIIVTPKAEWLGLKREALFSIKSEFVEIVPKDGYTYFWWAFLKSPSFLKSLPTGSGGTRPRASSENILKTPVRVPTIEVRQKIHEELSLIAQQEWINYILKEEILEKLLDDKHG